MKYTNHKAITVGLFVLLGVVSYAFYYNFDSMNQSVENFFADSCDVDAKIFDDLNEETIEDSVDSTEDTDVDEVDLDVDVQQPEHSHDRLVRKTEVYPMLQELNEKMEKKCPDMPDMSKYVLKSSIKPQQKCPDMSNYVLKTNILPEKKCPDCVCPKVNVSAGLCKKCAPCPACPPPKRCPRPKCPAPKPCPQASCPKPKPCPLQGKCPPPRPCPPCKKRKCTGCPYCEPKSDGLLYHPKYPGSKDFENIRANNGRCDGEPDLSLLSKFKNLF